MRLLLVDDDTKMVKVLKKILGDAHYVVDTAADGLAAEAKALANGYDAIVLDIGLPGKDGLAVCETLRGAQLSTPILMLTGRVAAKDRVAGLDTGADDYIPKPFSPSELMARLRAVLRRPEQHLDPVLNVRDLYLDPNRRVVRRGDATINLMPKEFALLEYLMRHPGKVIKRQELLHHVWGVYYANSSNRLEVYIRYLREKVDEPFDVKLIKTVRGSGYMLADEDTQ